jgi:hypothetical protein
MIPGSGRHAGTHKKCWAPLPSPAGSSPPPTWSVPAPSPPSPWSCSPRLGLTVALGVLRDTFRDTVLVRSPPVPARASTPAPASAGPATPPHPAPRARRHAGTRGRCTTTHTSPLTTTAFPGLHRQENNP